MGQEMHVVTGAYGFTGKYIASRLLNEGIEVRTLTNSPHRKNPFGGRIKAFLYNFGNFDELVDSMRGAAVLYNNYWVRFNYSDFSYPLAVENTLKLFSAAKRAGVKRIVHISITNPSEDSPFEYFRGKAVLEKELISSGIPYAILRPAVIFGKEDILINNIAWMLRKMPVFGVFGAGKYRLQPIYVDDLAGIAVDSGRRKDNFILNAIGPETFKYRELVKEIGTALGVKRPVISIPPRLGLLAGQIAGKLLDDVLITRDEVRGLMADLLWVKTEPVGTTKLTEWLRQNASTVGVRYHNELNRRKNRTAAYENI